MTTLTLTQESVCIQHLLTLCDSFLFSPRERDTHTVSDMLAESESVEELWEIAIALSGVAKAGTANELCGEMFKFIHSRFITDPDLVHLVHWQVHTHAYEYTHERKPPHSCQAQLYMLISSCMRMYVLRVCMDRATACACCLWWFAVCPLCMYSPSTFTPSEH